MNPISPEQVNFGDFFLLQNANLPENKKRHFAGVRMHIYSKSVSLLQIFLHKNVNIYVFLLVFV